ncbi:hypothetical protein [Streptomyces sp. LN699]|uniref:hypothetical protein n=1 Tax=Streptomyces sp. LN699 TaxID=3112981 RepID=UPI00371ED7FE
MPPYARSAVSSAALGFGPTPATLPAQDLAQDLAQTRDARAQTTPPHVVRDPGPLARLLSTHPDHRTRLHHLQRYLRATR